MEITTSKDNNYTVLNLNGRLDTNTSGSLEDRLEELFDKNENFIKLDFKELEYLSSAGLRVLLGAQKKINSSEGDMIIKNANSDIKEIFSITGFLDILKVD